MITTKLFNFLKKKANESEDKDIKSIVSRYSRLRQELQETQAEMIKLPKDNSRLDFQEKPSIQQGEMALGSEDLRNFGVYPYNPDDLILKKTLEIYDVMKKDDQVKAALSIKKLARLSTPYGIKPASKDPKDLEIAAFVKYSLDRIPGTFQKVLFSIMTALDYGFSINEKIWEVVPDGDFKGKISLKNIKSRRPHEFDFKMDDYSNITSVVQDQYGKLVDIPRKKILLWSYNSEWENPYGYSDLKAAYRPWWSKDVIMKCWDIFLERYPSPVFIGFYPAGTSEKDKDALLAVLEDVQIKTVAIIPEGIRIDTIETGRIGSEIYNRAIEKRDRMICRSVLVPDLLGMTDASGRGSYALGKKHFDVFLWVLFYLQQSLEELLREELIKELVDLNYDNVHGYPKFYLEAVSEESSDAKAKILQLLSQAGFIDPKSPDVQEWAQEYLALMPQTKTSTNLFSSALDFKTPIKYYDPSLHDSFELEILEEKARLEEYNDELRKL